MFRFTIRDVLWLMMVVGMGVGWCSAMTQKANLTREPTKSRQQADSLENTLDNLSSNWRSLGSIYLYPSRPPQP